MMTPHVHIEAIELKIPFRLEFSTVVLSPSNSAQSKIIAKQLANKKNGFFMMSNILENKNLKKLTIENF